MDDDMASYGTSNPLPDSVESNEVPGFPQVLVTEKIIFVIDLYVLENRKESDIDMHIIYILCKRYIDLKKSICCKPPEIECIFYNNRVVNHAHIHNDNELEGVFYGISKYEYGDDTEPLKLNKIFDRIAKLVEFPDPECSNNLPPDYVYHVVWFFGQNLEVPLSMENTNSFDFLMQSQYFALDIIYIYYSNTTQDDEISVALAGLNENNRGYYLQANSKEKLLSCVAQCLGHPLIREPQTKAEFNILKLGPKIETQENNNNNNNSEE